VKTLLIAALCISGTSAFAADNVVLPSKKDFHLFLLAGQSNMAGRGEVSAEDRTVHPRVLTLNKDGEWVPAQDPIHFDKPGAGVGPGRAFGIAVAESNPGITVGLIPGAVGGSPIDSWKPGVVWTAPQSRPYDEALDRTRRAMKDGTLKAIVWHQGESDANEKLAGSYETKLIALIRQFRADYNEPHLPIFIGQLGRFEKRPWTQYYRTVDQAHRDVAARDAYARYVSADGLTSKRDNIHFDAASARELGRRYARAYATWQKTYATK
jgi:Carbohydrate esterase, sialic acid-specific acetylesterase